MYGMHRIRQIHVPSLAEMVHCEKEWSGCPSSLHCKLLIDLTFESVHSLRSQDFGIKYLEYGARYDVGHNGGQIVNQQ